jgi:hypothetical protein
VGVAAKGKSKDEEAEVWSAISAFEQILEAMPNDRTWIETLAHAYEQIGDLTRAKDYLIRLADVMVGDPDRDAVQVVFDKLQPFVAEDPAAQAAADSLQETLAASPEPVAVSAPQESATAIPADLSPAGEMGGGFNIANELSFAWNLLQGNELSQEDYSSVVQDLTDMSGTDAAVTVSVLHVLNDRGMKNVNKIMVSVAKDCSTPIISLMGFDVRPEAFSLLPMEFMVKRGVIVYELFGQDALVTIMNPYDKQLMKDVEGRVGRKCHFYLTAPAEFDSMIEKISGWSADSASADDE